MKGHGDLRYRDTGVQVLLVHLMIHILILVHSNLGEQYGRITFVVEDNKKSVCTPTPEVWKRTTPYYLEKDYEGGLVEQKNLIYYQYDNTKYPHAGAGMRVQF